MAGLMENVANAALAGFASLDAEYLAARERQMRVVHVKRAAGTGSIDQLFALPGKFRLVFLRCHFQGIDAHAPLEISCNSTAGEVHNTKLFTILRAGPGNDAHFRLDARELQEPSAWSFQPGDAVRVTWPDPQQNTQWGAEAGLALAS